jgi:hypothetical protein
MSHHEYLLLWPLYFSGVLLRLPIFLKIILNALQLVVVTPSEEDEEWTFE